LTINKYSYTFALSLKTQITMQASTKQILTLMNIVFWVVFIGLLIKTGAFLFSFGMTLFNPSAAHNFYDGLDLSDLKAFSFWQYLNLVSLLVFLTALKAYLTYLVIMVFSTINFEHPFSAPVATRITKVSHVALGTGFLTLIAGAYSRWLIKTGAVSIEVLRELGGSAEFIFLAGIIFMIAQVFRRGIEIQSENELTI